jgi:hypothetical protein
MVATLMRGQVFDLPLRAHLIDGSRSAGRDPVEEEARLPVTDLPRIREAKPLGMPDRTRSQAFLPCLLLSQVVNTFQRRGRQTLATTRADC